MSLEGIIHADHRCHAAPEEAGFRKRKQHAARDQQIARKVELDAAGTEQQRQVYLISGF